MVTDEGAPPAKGSGVGLQGSFVMQKTGPLPNWGWMAIGLGAALGYAAWKSSKAKKDKAATDTTTGPNGAKAGANGSANGITYAFVDADSTVNTQYAYPPGGGRPPGGPDRRPHPSQAPDGQYVSVAKWTGSDGPWNSTLYGIAAHLWNDGDSWQAIWNAPQNSKLKQRTENNPEEIQPGDKIWVPSAPPGAGQDNEMGHPGHGQADHDDHSGGDSNNGHGGDSSNSGGGRRHGNGGQDRSAGHGSNGRSTQGTTHRNRSYS
jgi:hypothetical protein